MPPPVPDLHTHTHRSDGVLSPAELLQRAIDKGITHLAITDHDTTRAYKDLPVSSTSSLTVVPGIELSTCWAKTGIHILGLNIAPNHPVMQHGIEMQQRSRQIRAQLIAERLQKCGFPDLLAEASELAGTSTIGRPHFARCLVKHGHCKNMAAAFRKYLGNGKAGDVRHVWPPLSEIVRWIRESGGIAALAHPVRYKLTATRLRALVGDFADAGGEALEVVCGSQTADVTKKLAALCNEYDLSASCGSDFHDPGNRWSDLGRFSALPDNVTPVWERWNKIEPFA